jgi:uncharacterized membrane protein YtjA (UPF0391 family)
LERNAAAHPHYQEFGHRHLQYLNLESLDPHLKGVVMLRWALIFLVVAVVAGILGFGGIAGTAAGIAQFLFFLFIVLFVVALIFGRRVLA